MSAHLPETEHCPACGNHLHTRGDIEACTHPECSYTTTDSSRGVNGHTSAPSGAKDQPKDTSDKAALSWPPSRRVPAPLLANQRLLWAITILAGAAYIAVAIWAFTKGPTS